MVFKRYRFVDIIFISFCFVLIIEAQDSAYIVNKIAVIKEEIQVANQDSLSKIATENFKLNLKKASWYNSRKNATNILFFENDITEIIIPYNNAFVKFEFESADSIFTPNSKFKYKLSGLFSSWIHLEKTNALTFTHLPPGDYVLELMYSTGTGHWNIKELKIPFVVNQIFFKKWWFIAALIVFFAFMLFSIRKYELIHIEKMEELRLRISRDLHDELGSALTGIAIKSELLLEEIDLSGKKEILTEISEQSRSAVDTLSDIIWATDSSNNSIQNLAERMESTLYQFLTPLNITFTLQSIQDKKLLLINQDHRRHVFLIFKEALTNIMKHSNATHVFVSISKDKNNLKLVIKDNGTKAPKECSTLNGNGIKNIKLRTQKIHGKIHFSFSEGCKIELLFNYLNKKTT